MKSSALMMELLRIEKAKGQTSTYTNQMKLKIVSINKSIKPKVKMDLAKTQNALIKTKKPLP